MEKKAENALFCPIPEGSQCIFWLFYSLLHRRSGYGA
jgi:hypothetical protein